MAELLFGRHSLSWSSGEKNSTTMFVVKWSKFLPRLRCLSDYGGIFDIIRFMTSYTPSKGPEYCVNSKRKFKPRVCPTLISGDKRLTTHIAKQLREGEKWQHGY